MAYTPVGWQTGDTITADKLNRCDNGWGVESTQLFSETVTAAGDDSGIYGTELTYSQLIDAAIIIVTYDGTEYECPSIGAGEYGAPYNDGNPDFSEFPFNLYTDSGKPASLITQTAGEHTVAASVVGIETSSRFDAAVNKAVEDSAFKVISGTTTWQEVHDALIAGKYVYTVTEYSDSGNNITTVGHALRANIQKTGTKRYEVMFVEISGSTSPSVTFFYLGASSADGVLG